MKTKTIEFSTRKSLNEIINALRSFASSQKRTSISKIEQETDPFGSTGTIPDIMVVLDGQPSALAWAEHWGVQVYVTDAGSERRVELVALGDSFGAQMAMGMQNRNGAGNIMYVMRKSEKKMHELASVLA